MNLERTTGRIEPKTSPSPWRNHEHVRGFAVMVQPFESGDLLALRVWPESDFGSFTSVWHRTPEGEWTFFHQGGASEGCSRYWGPAVSRRFDTSIDLDWTGPNSLRVRVPEIDLDWTMTMSSCARLRALNAMAAAMPRWTWKPTSLRRLREILAERVLGMGRLQMAFTSPSGHHSIIAPNRIYFVDEAAATLGGRDLGRGVELDDNPTIGGVPMPRRGAFALAEAHARIIDEVEYRAACAAARFDPSCDSAVGSAA